MTLDIETIVQDVNAYLGAHGFTARDADQNDFQFGDDRRLRFKTGTSYGEVTITVWNESGQFGVIRILSESGTVDAKYEIDRYIWNSSRSIEFSEAEQA